MTKGFIIMKAMPPHKGHSFLINFAAKMVKTLYVMVGTLPTEPIDGALRYNWMVETFKDQPNIKIIWCPEDNPQYPEEHPDFWNIWKNSILSRVRGIDYLFASDDYGNKLAEVIGAKFVPVDIPRESFPISATKIRTDYMTHCFEALSVVRNHYNKVICITGPESAGKSTYTNKLAQYYNTKKVPEYARSFLEGKHLGMEFSKEDMDIFAKGIITWKDLLLPESRGFLFQDTDALITKIYSEIYFGGASPVVEELVKNERIDHYIVLTPEVSWEEDRLRDLPHMRNEFMDILLNNIKKLERPYTIISGDNHKDRLENIKRFLGTVKFIQ